MDIDKVEMKALTWKQPFAQLMLHGKIETRTWATSYRGLVLICAGKTPYTTNKITEMCGWGIHKSIGLTIDDKRLLLGSAIAVGNIVDCRAMLPSDEEQCFVKYNPALFCHVYENVKRIEPFPWKGSQGWRNVPQDIIEKIKYL